MKRNTTILFVAGTDTEVGKTYTAALLAEALRHSGCSVAVYKPVASGCRSEDGQLIAEDAVCLWNAAGQPGQLSDVCPQRFQAPLAPPEAAKCEGARVDAELLRTGLDVWLDSEPMFLIVEGAGGLMSPLADGVLNIDLCKQLRATLLIVAANRLGVIHQTLATSAAAEHHGITPAGIILCSPDSGDTSVAGNAKQIKQYSNVPLWAEIPFQASHQSMQGVVGQLIAS